jgi:hypothetical protein
MKAFAALYIALAILWGLLTTTLGVNSIPGRGFFYNYGRNFPAALVWPWQLIRSPYDVGVWILTPGIRDEFKPLHTFCLQATLKVQGCGCQFRELQKMASDADAKAIADAWAHNRLSLPTQMTMMLAKASAQCMSRD